MADPKTGRQQTRSRLPTTASMLSGWESGIFNLDEDDDSRNETPFTETDSLPSSYFQDQPHVHKALENDPQRRYKISVIKDLLKNFNLEDTVDHYRSLSSCGFSVSPANFSYDCASSARKLRERLMSLTGSDEVRINDPVYAVKLREKASKEYQNQMDHQEELRADAERIRLLKLLKRGVVSPEELHQTLGLLTPRVESRDVSPRHPRGSARRSSCRDVSPKRRTTIAVPKSSSGPRKKSSPPVPSPRRKTVPCATLTATEAPSPSTWLPALRRSYSPVPGLQATSPILGQRGVANSPKYDDMGKWSRVYTPESQMTLLERRSNLAVSRSDKCPTSASSRNSRISKSRQEKYEHPLVTEMRHEETVKGLYDLADELLPSKRKFRH